MKLPHESLGGSVAAGVILTLALAFVLRLALAA